MDSDFNPSPARRARRCVRFLVACGILVVLVSAGSHSNTSTTKAKSVDGAMPHVVLKQGPWTAAGEITKDDRQPAVPVKIALAANLLGLVSKQEAPKKHIPSHRF